MIIEKSDFYTLKDNYIIINDNRYLICDNYEDIENTLINKYKLRISLRSSIFISIPIYYNNDIKYSNVEIISLKDDYLLLIVNYNYDQMVYIIEKDDLSLFTNYISNYKPSLFNYINMIKNNI